ncbi:two-component system, sensor histidine kinase RegB [Tranquillimonas rosea]|uniref:histidine kinase n=1 Tax=Tranquillimonas rosea TaxID=641238 RepID=A0A1H9SR40_9RHOB|nr:ATP-binding protein [Tranquillimonas rosea]SER87344.1 two-component system, sensor histidine kinase RegB [Tranquillimonas rosea]
MSDQIAPAEAAANRQNLILLTQLRWIAAAGQIATILTAHYALGIPLPVGPMASVVALLLVLNIGTLWRHRRKPDVLNGEILAQILLDVAALSAQLHFSGGAANPFVMLYLLQIILGAVLLTPRAAWALVALTVLSFAALMFDPLSRDLRLAPDGNLPRLHVIGSLICFLLTAGLLVYFIGRIGRNLRARDRRLSDLSRQAVEEEHIVRLGLLASGAAHELGTPLAVLSVILGDWQRTPHFADDPDLAEDMREMQVQLDRCKDIVSGILVSSGEMRGETVSRTSVTTFLGETVAEWRATRPTGRIEFQDRFHPDQQILYDPALRQVIASLFDNAFEATPDMIRVTAEREDDALVLTVEDRGPGFDADMLESFGRPYASTKGRPGGGLGLYLVVNVMRKLGGNVVARNREEGGASVILTLPIDRLSPENAIGGQTHASHRRG